MMEHIDTTPVSVSQIRTQTAHDPTLSRVTQFVMNGWAASHNLPLEFQPFVKRKSELSIQDNCLLVVVPPKLRDRVLRELHNSHPGTSRMKNFARQYIWWPGMDREIENVATFVRTHVTNPPQETYIHGSGLDILGKEFTLIMQGHSLVECF